MLFNSQIFILLFLPIAVFFWYLINYFGFYKTANWFLVIMCLWFYGYYNKMYLLIICGSVLFNFLFAKALCYEFKKLIKRKIILGIGIFTNIAIIFYFKYFDFFIENINVVFKTSFELRHIVLPLGISFYTFQQISYLLDTYHHEIEHHSFGEYVLYVLFFPQLIAGPIVMFGEMIPQVKNKMNRRIIYANFSKGMYIFSLGLLKKVLLADTFGQTATYGFEHIGTLNSLEGILVSVAYTFQLYFDFSGYCDMALGIGYLFNIELPQNFNSPYKSKSIVEFWSRWHITLTRFLKKYVYIPLGGNRKGKIRTYINIMVVYLISGIWHGANWTFVLWGLLHGFLNCINRLIEKVWKRIGGAIQWAITFTIVDLLWILFRADSISHAFKFLKIIFSTGGYAISGEICSAFNLYELDFIERKIPLIRKIYPHIKGFNMWIFIVAAFIIVLKSKNSKEIEFKPTIGKAVLTVIFTLWSVLSLEGLSIFLYFNF